MGREAGMPGARCSARCGAGLGGCGVPCPRYRRGSSVLKRSMAGSARGLRFRAWDSGSRVSWRTRGLYVSPVVRRPPRQCVFRLLFFVPGVNCLGESSHLCDLAVYSPYPPARMSQVLVVQRGVHQQPRSVAPGRDEGVLLPRLVPCGRHAGERPCDVAAFAVHVSPSLASPS